MATVTRFQSSGEIGVFSLLTNSYCLVGMGTCENFYASFEQELANHIPVVHTKAYDTRIIGTMLAGNKNGLVVPSIISDNELQHLRNSLPEEVRIRKIDDRISTLGNCISCNDHVALIHPEFDRESEELIGDVLGVEVFRTTIAGNSLVGTYSAFNNKGGIVHPATTLEEYEELANLMQVPIGAATINRGSELIGSGVVVNDWSAFVGFQSTSAEIDNIEKIFQISHSK